MKILCTGDLHLGAGAELGRAPGDRLADQREVLGRIAGIAVERGVDLILNAGDTFDGPGVPPEQLAAYADFVDACHRTIGIPILAITGNGKHDAAVRSTNGLAIFAHIPGIIVSSTPDVYEFAGCAVATLPWVHPGKLIARNGGDVSRDEINDGVAQLLVEIASRGKDGCEHVAPGLPHILLGHWSVTGAALPNGLPVADLREPVIPIAELDQLGFGHIVLGHIHRAQEVGERGFYVGSPMPLNFGEDTDPRAHGVYILDTGETESIDAYAAEFVPIESRPLVTIDYDITGNGVESNDLEVYLDGQLEGGIVRLRYRATQEQQRRIDIGELRATLFTAGAHSVKVVPDIVRADRARVEGVDENLTTLDALGLYIEANAIDPELADAMRDHTTRYLEAVA